MVETSSSRRRRDSCGRRRISRPPPPPCPPAPTRRSARTAATASPFLDDHVRAARGIGRPAGRPAAARSTARLRRAGRGAARDAPPRIAHPRHLRSAASCSCPWSRSRPLPETPLRDGVWCVTVRVRRESRRRRTRASCRRPRRAYQDLPAGVHEGLLVAEDGALLEGLSSNFFAVCDGSAAHRGDAGPARHHARAGPRARARDPARSLRGRPPGGARRARRRCFITSVSREVLGVVRVDDVTIGRRQAGGRWRSELRRRYRARMRSVAEHLLRR